MIVKIDDSELSKDTKGIVTPEKFRDFNFEKRAPRTKGSLALVELTTLRFKITS